MKKLIILLLIGCPCLGQNLNVSDLKNSVVIINPNIKRSEMLALKEFSKVKGIKTWSKNYIDSIVISEHRGRFVVRTERTYDIDSDSIYFGLIQSSRENERTVAYFTSVKTKEQLAIFRKLHPKVKIPQRILDKIK